jgi:ribosome recycling factor
MIVELADVIGIAKDKISKTISILKKDLNGLRAGRANPQVLDRILVDYYGTPTPINQLGNISSPEPRMLVISLWDQKAIPMVEKAIQKSDLGINPSNDGKLIRLVFPELTEERRKDLVKVVRKKGEEAKIAVRAIRRDTNEQIKKQRKDNEITEDDQKKMESDVQKLTDDMIKDIDKIIADKEKEILEV